jgi:hypothetical protein
MVYAESAITKLGGHFVLQTSTADIHCNSGRACSSGCYRPTLPFRQRIHLRHDQIWISKYGNYGDEYEAIQLNRTSWLGDISSEVEFYEANEQSPDYGAR